jgi:hypothetical protein
MHVATQSKSFIEILEDEIRHDLKREMREELERAQAPRNPQAIHAAGRLETWLASHVGPITFKTNRQPYGAPPKRAASLPPPPAVHAAETTEEMLALALLSRHSGRALNAQYTHDELKTVWRKAALKTHPDRFVGSDQVTIMRATCLFRELAAAYELLSSKTAA